MANIPSLPADHAQPQILVVEDETLLALDLEDFLRRSGYEVKVCATVKDARAVLASDDFDGAILDVDVSGEFVFPVAEALQDRKTPFMVVSGHPKDVVPERYRNRPFIPKPYEHGDVLKTLGAIVHP